MERKLDSLIAEKIFGLRVEVTQEETSGYSPGAQWVGGGDYYEEDVYWAIPPARYEDWQNGEDDGDGEWFLQPYSTEIAWAWGVTEQMRQRDWRCYLRNWHVSSDWMATFACGQAEHTITDSTAPLAICRAALRAFGIEA